MSRGFIGARGSGGDSQSVHKKVSAKDRWMNKQRGIANDVVLSKEDLYKQRLDERMIELQAQAMKGRDGRELSKGAQVAIELMAQKQAKAAAKRAKKRSKVNVDVKARSLVGRFGGRIDNKGNIYGPDNKVCATVDLKTGKIKTNMGTSIGKYGKNNSDHLIAMHIEKVYSAPSAHSTTFGGGTASSIWGVGSGSTDDDPTGGFWG